MFDAKDGGGQGLNKVAGSCARRILTKLRTDSDRATRLLHALPPQVREYDVLDEDVARLSPLRHANLNCLGRCRRSRSRLTRTTTLERAA